MTTHDLSIMFNGVLQQTLDTYDLAKAIVANAQEPCVNICHTHDYCDPNQCMIDALAALGVEFDPHDEEQGKLIAAAWKESSDDFFGAFESYNEAEAVAKGEQ